VITVPESEDEEEEEGVEEEREESKRIVPFSHWTTVLNLSREIHFREILMCENMSATNQLIPYQH